MKLGCLAVPIILVSFLPQPTRTLRRAVHGSKNPPANASLQLTTSVVKQILCTDGQMRIWLGLRYTNTGTEPIILSRYSSAISRYTVSRDEIAAAKGRHEKVVHLFNTYSVPEPTRGRRPPEESFVILNSGESYDINQKITYWHSLLVDSSEVRRFQKGNHVLQVSVPTWFEQADLAQELSVAWRKYGVLWWQGITSEPMPFKVEKPAVTVKCS